MVSREEDPTPGKVLEIVFVGYICQWHCPKLKNIVKILLGS